MARPPAARRHPACVSFTQIYEAATQPALAWLACLLCLALAWSGLGPSACLASNNNRPPSVAGGGCAAAVVVAGKAGKTGPGQTKPRRGTTSKPAKPRRAGPWALPGPCAGTVTTSEHKVSKPLKGEIGGIGIRTPRVVPGPPLGTGPYVVRRICPSFVFCQRRASTLAFLRCGGPVQ